MRKGFREKRPVEVEVEPRLPPGLAAYLNPRVDRIPPVVVRHLKGSSFTTDPDVVLDNDFWEAQRRVWQERFSLELCEAAPPPAVPAVFVKKRPADLTGEDLTAALLRHAGNKARAARELGIAYNTLKAYLRKFGLPA